MYDRGPNICGKFAWAAAALAFGYPVVAQSQMLDSVPVAFAPAVGQVWNVTVNRSSGTDINGAKTEQSDTLTGRFEIVETSSKSFRIAWTTTDVISGPEPMYDLRPQRALIGLPVQFVTNNHGIAIFIENWDEVKRVLIEALYPEDDVRAPSQRVQKGRMFLNGLNAESATYYFLSTYRVISDCTGAAAGSRTDENGRSITTTISNVSDSASDIAFEVGRSVHLANSPSGLAEVKPSDTTEGAGARRTIIKHDASIDKNTTTTCEVDKNTGFPSRVMMRELTVSSALDTTYVATYLHTLNILAKRTE